MIPTEIWKNITGYESLYQVSNYGKVKRFYKNKRNRNKSFLILKPGKDNKGYSRVTLCKGGIKKSYHIYRLVLETFVGPCPLGTEGCHNNGDKENDFIGNLRWDTRKANILDSVRHGTHFNYRNTKLKDNQIIMIRHLHSRGISTKELSIRFRVGVNAIYSIINCKTWKHIKEEKNE